jgi:excisionase family DNA binding protein
MRHETRHRQGEPGESPVWLRTREAARRADCSEPTILRAARSGRLKSVRLNNNRSRRYRPEWVDAWLESGR